ncbi:hypothetical protein K440DRAFT_637559 [Wilcoxina mikolae CBS 423.85]|nr:hypothetical protein K440DRAFT_637559 [Wilcoxina mikolae CBS 423.85]
MSFDFSLGLLLATLGLFFHHYTIIAKQPELELHGVFGGAAEVKGTAVQQPSRGQKAPGREPEGPYWRLSRNPKGNLPEIGSSLAYEVKLDSLIPQMVPVRLSLATQPGKCQETPGQENPNGGVPGNEMTNKPLDGLMGDVRGREEKGGVFAHTIKRCDC